MAHTTLEKSSDKIRIRLSVARRGLWRQTRSRFPTTSFRDQPTLTPPQRPHRQHPFLAPIPQLVRFSPRSSRLRFGGARGPSLTWCVSSRLTDAAITPPALIGLPQAEDAHPNAGRRCPLSPRQRNPSLFHPVVRPVSPSPFLRHTRPHPRAEVRARRRRKAGQARPLDTLQMNLDPHHASLPKAHKLSVRTAHQFPTEHPAGRITAGRVTATFLEWGGGRCTGGSGGWGGR